MAGRGGRLRRAEYVRCPGVTPRGRRAGPARSLASRRAPHQHDPREPGRAPGRLRAAPIDDDRRAAEPLRRRRGHLQRRLRGAVPRPRRAGDGPGERRRLDRLGRGGQRAAPPDHLPGRRPGQLAECPGRGRRAVAARAAGHQRVPRRRRPAGRRHHRSAAAPAGRLRHRRDRPGPLRGPADLGLPLRSTPAHLPGPTSGCGPPGGARHPAAASGPSCPACRWAG